MNIQYTNSTYSESPPHRKDQHRGHKYAVAALRYEADRRQIGAMLVATGLCAVFQPLASISIFVDPSDGDGQTPGRQGMQDFGSVEFWSFVGSIFFCWIGIFAIMIGYFELIHDQGSRVLTGMLIVFTQTAYIPYIVGIIDIAQKMNLPPEENVFIPVEYNPTQEDIAFVGVLGIFLFAAYGFAFIGSIAFMLFSLYAFQSGKPEQRPASYYSGRLAFYSFVLGLAGISQLMLGCFVMTNFESGVLRKNPVSVAFMHIHFPALTATVGLIQLFDALWGWARSLDCAHFGPDDISYALSIFLAWIVVLGLQVVTQTSYAPGEQLAHVTPSAAAMMFGIILMPAYLDQKSRTTPQEFPENYYYVGELEDRWLDED